MAADVLFSSHGPLALVTLHQPGRMNAMSRAMWRGLRSGFERLAADPALRCVLVAGADGNFCAGGDIAEYPQFRFDTETLRAFHEELVWGALAAMLALDVPLLAQIEGNCMGAGIEIASCCDIRIGADSARFGAPIARLGFPMAPRELDLVLRAAGAGAVREMLLEARVLDAQRMGQLGFLNQVVPQAQLAALAHSSQQRICALAPQAARMHKRLLRVLTGAGSANGTERPQPRPRLALREDARKPVEGPAASCEARDLSLLDTLAANAYASADPAENRAGIEAFIHKRKPAF